MAVDEKTYLNPENVRSTFKANAEQYALSGLAQEAEIEALEALGSDLDENGRAELTGRRIELRKVRARRDAFAKRLAALPAKIDEQFE